MKSYGKFPLSYLSNITLELPGRLQEKINGSGQGFRFLNLTIICVLHRGPCLIYCLHSGSWDVWGNGLANNSLLQHKPWFISSISFSNSARGQNARRYNSVLLTFTNKIPLDYFFKKKNGKKKKKRTSHWWKPTEFHLPNQQDWTLRETRYTSAFQAKRGTDFGTCATFSCVGKPWWGMRQMNCQMVSLQGGRQKWENCLPNSERDIKASQRSISPSNLYPLLLLHTSLPLASLLPASSFCVQCCKLREWEKDSLFLTPYWMVFISLEEHLQKHGLIVEATIFKISMVSSRV